MNERLKELYSKVIIKNNQEPYHFEKRSEATHIVKAYNPLCGDKFELFFEIKDGALKEVYFHGHGCAISKASTSILLQVIENQGISEVEKKLQSFLSLLNNEDPEGSENELFEAFTAAKHFPGRLKCATLAWEALEDFLREG